MKTVTKEAVKQRLIETIKEKFPEYPFIDNDSAFIIKKGKKSIKCDFKVRSDFQVHPISQLLYTEDENITSTTKWYAYVGQNPAEYDEVVTFCKSVVKEEVEK